jgi:hypothetical protein
MLTTASSFDALWLEVLNRLPRDLDLDCLARDSKALIRKRGVTDAADLLRLGLARGPGGMSLAQTALWAGLNGIGEFTGEALNQRLHKSTAFFEAIVRHLLAARAPVRPTPWAGRCLRLHDSSSLRQPGGKGANWRIHAVYDLAAGNFVQLVLTDEKGPETLTCGPPAGGAIAIADRGYAHANDMAAFVDRAAEGEDFIIRIGWNSLRLETRDGKPFDLIALLTKMSKRPPGAAAAPREWTGLALHGRGKTLRRLPIRLVIQPLPPEKAAIAREKARRIASKHQTRLNPSTVLAAGFLMLATSLPAAVAGADIAAVYRLRWQIELAFKRLKSLIGVDRLPTRTDAGGRSWILAHLILALLSEDFCQEVLDSPP